MRDLKSCWFESVNTKFIVVRFKRERLKMSVMVAYVPYTDREDGVKDSI